MTEKLVHPVLTWHVFQNQAQILNVPGGDNDKVGYYRPFSSIILLSMDFLKEFAVRSESRV